MRPWLQQARWIQRGAGDPQARRRRTGEMFGNFCLLRPILGMSVVRITLRTVIR